MQKELANSAEDRLREGRCDESDEIGKNDRVEVECFSSIQYSSDHSQTGDEGSQGANLDASELRKGEEEFQAHLIQAWDQNEVCNWLVDGELGILIPLFRRNGINGAALRELLYLQAMGPDLLHKALLEIGVAHFGLVLRLSTCGFPFLS
jgi:hypothetical protein